MAAFERVRSGIPEMDASLDNIRLGDNVVWRVSDLDEFRVFLEPFVRQAIEDGRNLIYVRFASHPPLVRTQPGVKVVPIELSHRFETFTVAIHNLIAEEGREAFYVFDCLSELQTAWATDLMMGNFFRVTCPFLFRLDTVAYFPLIRGKHSFQAIAKIQDTTQLFLDVYSDDSAVYVRPVKVWNRFLETLFLPHRYDPAEGTFRPVLDGVQASRFYAVMNRHQRSVSEQNRDAWDRFFDATRAKADAGQDVTEECARMCDIMMTRDSRMRRMIKRHFNAYDYLDIRDHMIGTGMIGGKACGMLLARKLVEDEAPDLSGRFEPHDSYYIGSDVYYTYIVENGYWEMRIRQRTDAEYFSLADTFAEKLRTGEFPREMEEQFVHLLEYYGQDPIIVRSSSILEDGFGNAFAGKYESVFCANSGSMEDRLSEFKDAIRTVYASSMSLSALDYRKRRGLEKRDEQMAILVQRVSGSHYGEYYMPCAAGVGYSMSPYRIRPDMNPEAGMLRLVMGLGISAVDRTEGSYPRLVNLDSPEAVTAVTDREKHQYSQRGIEVVSREKKCVLQIELRDIEDCLPAYLQDLLLEHDYEAERMFRDRGQRRVIRYISCTGLVKRKDLMDDMRRMLKLLQDSYGCAVDTEFTINLAESGEYVINLLQCRPLTVCQDRDSVYIPQSIPEDQILIETVSSSMGLSRDVQLDRIVCVDPIAYYRMPYAEKSKVAKVVGNVNWSCRGKGLHMMLIVPGRIGTSSPELGVPTAFSDISEFCAICEVAEARAGYNPELSYGSHIFQDLVEAGILYTAIFENERTVHFRPELLHGRKNLLPEFAPEGEAAELSGIVGVYDVSDCGSRLLYDMKENHTVVFFSS